MSSCKRGTQDYDPVSKSDRENAIARLDDQESASTIIIADVSGSMRGDKIERLRRELKNLWPEITARLLAFSDRMHWCDGPSDLPNPMGGTNLKLAFETVAALWPSEVILVSDGRPQDEQGALDAAELIPGTISVLFVGDESDSTGADFMRCLAALGGGLFAHRDLAKNLAIDENLRAMLSLPAPIAL